MVFSLTKSNYIPNWHLHHIFHQMSLYNLREADYFAYVNIWESTKQHCAFFVSINCHILLHSYYRSLDATWWRTSNTNPVCSLLLFSILQNWNIQLSVCFTYFYFTHAEGESTISLYRTTSVLKALHSHTAVWLSWVIRPWVRLNVGWSLLGIKWHEFINQWRWNCSKFCLNRCNKTNSEWRRCRS